MFVTKKWWKCSWQQTFAQYSLILAGRHSRGTSFGPSGSLQVFPQTKQTNKQAAVYRFLHLRCWEQQYQHYSNQFFSPQIQKNKETSVDVQGLGPIGFQAADSWLEDRLLQSGSSTRGSHPAGLTQSTASSEWHQVDDQKDDYLENKIMQIMQIRKIMQII